MVGIVHSLAVGPNESYSKFTRYFSCLLLQFLTLGSSLTEPAGNDHSALYTLLTAILNSLRYEARRYDENSQVRRFLQFLDIGMTGKIEDGVSFGIYWIDGSLVAAVQDVFQNLMTQLVWTG
jgi:hypothetical protein